MRLIDADALTQDLVVNRGFYPVIVKCAIEQTQTVSAEIIVHCRDCRKRDTPSCNMTHDMGGGRFLTCNEDLGYCNFAEMKPIKIDKARKAND